MIDAQEQAKASYSDPFASLRDGGNGTYSRYEITAAWPSILSSFADDGDLVFSAALNGTVLEAGDLQATPFPLSLVFIGDTAQPTSWGYKQFMEHSEYIQRLQNKLEDLLQTAITLGVKTRAYTETELQQRLAAKMSPFELDLQKDPSLAKLKELFAAELVYSRKLAGMAPIQTDEYMEQDS